MAILLYLNVNLGFRSGATTHLLISILTNQSKNIFLDFIDNKGDFEPKIINNHKINRFCLT